jgi:uncharacterized damage-inducible protein DinB
MTISEMLLPEFDQEMASTRKILACVPDDKLSWKPHEKSMTLGRLASHVAEMPHWALPTMGQDSLEIKPGETAFNAASSAEILAYFDKNAVTARELIAGASDEAMARPWSFIYNGHPVFTMPKAAVLRNMVFNHMVHHRGQLSVYLRMQDVAIPGMYGPSADERL